MYNSRRSNFIVNAAKKHGILQKNDTIYKAQVAIMETTEGQQENMNKLHFGIVNRAIGLNRKGVFLWKITFGPCGSNHLQHFDGYETSSVQWNAVVTLEEIRIMLENTNLNEPQTYSKVSNSPVRGDNTNVYRVEFVGRQSNNVKNSSAYLHVSSSPISPRTVLTKNTTKECNILRSSVTSFSRSQRA